MVCVQDEDMYRGLAQLFDLESVFVEPSCATVLMGPAALSALANTWAQGSGPMDGKGVAGRAKAEFLLQEGVHVLWMTGGGLVPVEEQQQCNEIGLKLLVPDTDLKQLLQSMNLDK
jgi:D-serine dehydratase